MNPRFSIVTPCFNSRALLPRCVGSVRGQGPVVLEHLIQDGGSKDDTAAWASSQPGLLVRSERDRGMYDAIGRGWTRARGDILSWLNCDEQYLPGTLARVDRAFREHPEADVVHGDFLVVDPQGRALAARREIPLRARYVSNGFLNVFSCATFFHRRLLDAGLLKFDPAFRVAGDADLILCLLEAGRKFVQVHEYFSLFGVDGNNLSTQGPLVAKEAALVRERHGALRSAALRRCVMLGRYAERLLAGCYRTDTVSYAFALDETPAYREFKHVRAASRFTYGRVARQLAAGSATGGSAA